MVREAYGTGSLQNNKISGDIPPEIGKLINLNALDLSSNEFVGDIPNSLGQLTQLNYLRLDRNNLSGQIPVDVAKLPGLTFLDLSFNNLSEVMSHPFCSLPFQRNPFLIMNPIIDLPTCYGGGGMRIERGFQKTYKTILPASQAKVFKIDVPRKIIEFS